MRVLWLRPEATGGAPVEASIAAQVVACPSAALECLRLSGFDAVLADLPAGEWTTEEWLEEAQRIRPQTPLIVREERCSLERGIRLVKLGAHTCLEWADCEAAGRALADAAVVGRLRAKAAAASGPEPWLKLLVGESPALQAVIETIRLVGSRRCTVLITGETGTGKELLARAIHLASPRSHFPMTAVNCHALPESLLEAELFGHVRGAFTGAVGNRVGRFEQANRATLFLDEIGDMPVNLQAKLLRVLQEREFQRIGSSETIKVDVRVVAATNADLPDRIAEGKFREDLYYRLNVVPLRSPPLRERLTDVPLLVQHFIEKTCRREDLSPKEISPEALDRLSWYSWPGNVRQLENAVEMAVLLSGERQTLHPGDFPLPRATPPKPASLSSLRLPENGLDFERTIACLERSLLDQALIRTGGNKKAAAEILRLKRTTLSAKLKSLEAVGV